MGLELLLAVFYMSHYSLYPVQCLSRHQWGIRDRRQNMIGFPVFLCCYVLIVSGLAYPCPSNRLRLGAVWGLDEHIDLNAGSAF